MALLLDTQILVWFGIGDRRLSSRVKEALLDTDTDLFVSAIVAYEFEDFRMRGRLGTVDALGSLIAALRASILDFRRKFTGSCRCCRSSTVIRSIACSLPMRYTAT